MLIEYSKSKNVSVAEKPTGDALLVNSSDTSNGEFMLSITSIGGSRADAVEQAGKRSTINEYFRTSLT